MNEITRIHIAKVAYDIELTAKKQLQNYIKSLESYTGDSEVLRDIEIRITELLGERGVAAGGVIGSEDIVAIREQLGEPYEFAAEDGDIAVGGVEPGDGKRKLFRSVDDALLGGVLSGVAAFFRIDPIWVRLAFIVLTFASFGLAIVVYIFMWIFVPAALSATDKLRQAGQPVTLDSIRQLNADEALAPSNSVAPRVKQVLSTVLGVGSLLGAMAVFALIVATVFGIDSDHLRQQFGLLGASGEPGFAAGLVLAIIIAGLVLLTSLFGLVAYAFFTQKFTRRIFTSALIIIVLGLTAVGSSIGIVASQAWRASNEAQSLIKQTKVALPAEFAQVKTVTIEQVKGKTDDTPLGYSSIEYVVSTDAPRYELRGLPNVKPVVKIDGETATISMVMPEDYRNTLVQTTLVVYGPALTKVTNNASSTGYSATAQDTIELVGGDNSSFSLNGGQYNSVIIHGEGNIDLGLAAITNLNVSTRQGVTVNAGTIRDLTVAMPDVCPTGYSVNTRVTVAGVTSGNMTYNGEQRVASTTRTNCSEVIFENLDTDTTD